MFGGFLKNIRNIHHDVIDNLVNKPPGLERYCCHQQLVLPPLLLLPLCPQQFWSVPTTRGYYAAVLQEQSHL